MKLANARILLTGGAGGIGRAMAAEFLRAGAAVLLADRDEVALRAAAGALAASGDRVESHCVDLADAGERRSLAQLARQWRGGVNVLVNNAGVAPFSMLEAMDERRTTLALQVNLLAMIELTRLLLPHFGTLADARVLNIGSVFGHIGYPGYTVYSATKFAVRGFSEALRRELADGPVRVHYLAPRATRTTINSAEVEQMNRDLGVAMDAPAVVAAAARQLLEHDRPAKVIGWPERLYARVNALLPGVVDRSLRRQLPVIRRHAGVRNAQAQIPAPATEPKT